MTCPYCGGVAIFVDSAVVYSKSYGMIYLCRPCKAWVGVHKGTDKPLGRLANAELREWKQKAHNSFDKLWRSGNMSRSESYKWLSQILNIDPDKTHIGMFDIEYCKDVLRALGKL